jgi:hypothetical protein
MCKLNKNQLGKKDLSDQSKSVTNTEMPLKARRGKRVKQVSLALETDQTTTFSRVSSSLSKKHAGNGKSGGIEAILPSLGIVIVLAFAFIAKSGFRGRASVAGIDLGTTNSVICVQHQAKGGEQIQWHEHFAHQMNDSSYFFTFLDLSSW